MNTITALLKQQIISVINISIPLLIVIYYYPSWVLQIETRLLCAIAMGIYIAYLNYNNTKKMTRLLQFVPTSHYKQQLEQWIVAAGMDPEKIQIRYGYCHESLAMTMFDTIVIDPLVYTLFEQDSTAQEAKQVIDTYIMPTRSEEVKRKILQFKTILSPQAQQFIFMHELGHIYDRYSIKKIMIIGIIGTLAAYIGISMGVYLFPLIAGYAIICALLIGGLVDIVLSYLSNLFFKLAEEKDADLFAASHCDTDTINAAADFFENHQEIVDQHKQYEGLLARLPSSIASGHPNGKTRAVYLRELTNQ
jgi:hypothetical protein